MDTRRLESLLIGAGAAIIVMATIRSCDKPPSPEQQIGAGKEIQKIAAPVVKAAEIRYKRDTIVLGKIELSYAGIRGAMQEDEIAGRPFDTLKAKPALDTADKTIDLAKSARIESDRIADGLREINRGLKLELVGTQRERDQAKRGKVVVGVVSFVAGVGTGVILDRVQSAVRKPP